VSVLEDPPRGIAADGVHGESRACLRGPDC
jgi:hypothetical protein